MRGGGAPGSQGGCRERHVDAQVRSVEQIAAVVMYKATQTPSPPMRFLKKRMGDLRFTPTLHLSPHRVLYPPCSPQAHPRYPQTLLPSGLRSLG